MWTERQQCSRYYRKARARRSRYIGICTVSRYRCFIRVRPLHAVSSHTNTTVRETPAVDSAGSKQGSRVRSGTAASYCQRCRPFSSTDFPQGKGSWFMQSWGGVKFQEWQIFKTGSTQRCCGPWSNLIFLPSFRYGARVGTLAQRNKFAFWRPMPTACV